MSFKLIENGQENFNGNSGKIFKRQIIFQKHNNFHQQCATMCCLFVTLRTSDCMIRF